MAGLRTSRRRHARGMSRRRTARRPRSAQPAARGKLRATTAEPSQAGPPPPEPASEPPAKPRGRADAVVEAWLDHNAPLVVPVTCWFEPPPEPPVQSVTMQFVGRRIDGSGPPQPGDEFVHEETLKDVVAGSGPIAVTAKIRDVNPGEWEVKARLLHQAGGDVRWIRRRPVPLQPIRVHRARWSWLRWHLFAGPAAPVTTCLAPFARPPAVLLGSWAVFVPLGVVVALVIQALIISAARLQLPHVLLVSVLAVVAGVIGAKAWYVALHWRERRWDGWGVGGFLTGLGIALPVLLVLVQVPIGSFLDASAPALMFGLAIGRLGCFFTGCCAGRPTASRFGVWSSDRRIGARRVPAQLLESASALIIGLPVLAALLAFGPRNGALFVCAFAAYTLIRQGLLLVREERSQTRVGVAVVAAAAAILLAAGVAFVTLA